MKFHHVGIVVNNIADNVKILENILQPKKTSIPFHDKIQKKNVVSLECGHMFHTNCIICLVKKRNRKCPLCRTRIRWHIKQLNRHNDLYED